jgi:dihydrodipicolinate synthase/N-acetylneuraminate lyase
MKAALEGVIPILPTPFTAEGAIDDAGFSRVIDAALNAGVSAVAMFGLASEYYKLADAEREHLTRLLLKHVANRCPVIVSITPHSTQLAVAEAVRAADFGADALMVMPPFFMATPIPEIVRHIRAVAGSVSIPVIIQYAPLQTGRPIDISVFASLCEEIPNISHIKVDLVPSGPVVSSLAENRINSLVGYMGLHLIEDFERGASGIMPSVSIAPAFVRIWRSLSGDIAAAKELHARLLPFLNFVMQSVEFLVACEKALLVDAGIIDSAFCRAPSYALDSVQRKELQWHRDRLAASIVQFPPG